MSNIIRIGMADLNIAKPNDSLQTVGLGSCIGICLWDPLTRVGGMAHIMLPTSNNSQARNDAKFADTAVPVLIKNMVNAGADRKRIVAKIAGGAQMFAFYGAGDNMKIGERNAEATKIALSLENIKLLAFDTGGNFGRTIEFFTETGKLHIRTINLGEKYI